ncbi:MAG: oligosaccharide flippase family protein [Cyanobacteria bacterium P01_D01_bin.50]
MTSLKKLAYRGAIWTIAGHGGNQILRFGSNLILTRLLVPEYYGLVAIVNTLRMGIELFSDVGIGQSIINNKLGDEPSFRNTAWTIKVIRGFILWFILLLLTVPIANIYDDRRLLWLVPITGFSVVIDGFSSTSLQTLQRHLDLGKLAQFDFIVMVLVVLSMITWAWFNPSSWALAIGTISAAVYKAVGSHLLIREYNNRFTWNQDALREILSFGKFIFVATALMFMAEQADRLILGKLLSFETLGVYSIAYILANAPKEILKKLSYRVIFPAISNQADIPRSALRAKILRQRRIVIFGFGVSIAALVTLGDFIIATLYDERYAEATWMMPILCCGIWFSLLFYTISPALLAIKKPLYSAQSNLARFVIIAIGLPLAFYNFGVLGAICVVAVGDLPLYIVNLWGLKQEQLSCISQDIQGTVFFIVILALFLFIRHSLGFGLPIQAIL